MKRTKLTVAAGISLATLLLTLEGTGRSVATPGGGGDPGTGQGAQVVGQAQSTYPPSPTTTNPYATVAITQTPNTDNEGSTNNSGTDLCQSTTDQLAGSFDYSTTLYISNPTDDSMNVYWSAQLTVSGNINYAKGEANSTSTLAGSGPTDSCNMPGGPNSYGGNPQDSGSPNGIATVDGDTVEPVAGGVESGSSTCNN